jgi:hypothetical protein
MRHKIRNSDGEYTLGIGREHFINPVKWQKYVPPFEIFGDDFEKMFAEFLSGNSGAETRNNGGWVIKYTVPRIIQKSI